MNKAIIVLGPTTTGKTDLGIFLAKKFNGEIISADSRQVYKGLDIGTGKLPVFESRSMNHESWIKKNKGFWIMDGVKVYCLDVADPKKQYSVKDFIDDASVALEKINKSKKLAIIVGGSGLYIKALTEGIENLSVPINRKLRRSLESLNVEKLQKKFRKVSAKKWNLINNSDRKNKRRLVRAIEVLMYPYRKKIQNSKFKVQKYNYLKIGLMAPIRVLREKIRNRVYSRFDQGLIEEAKNLRQQGLSIKRMKELGLDYKLLAEYMEGKINEDVLKSQIVIKNGQYAKRQLTWFRKMNGVNWFDITQQTYFSKVEKLVSLWYD